MPAASRRRRWTRLITGTNAGRDVGVARIASIIDHTEGKTDVAKDQQIECGEYRLNPEENLRPLVKEANFVGAISLEVYLARKMVSVTPDCSFGAREGTIEAVFHDMRYLTLIVDEEFIDFLKRLETAGLSTQYTNWWVNKW
ncbi:MAG: hypothetical protein LBU24_04905 [Methanocalculaceae archaeon]|jgi:putative transcriptional regulator|nr:hypothetical protein [Methanocalculaceae archaeon]